MKKKVLSIVLVVILTLLGPVAIAHAESLAHLESEEGIIDIVSYEVKEADNIIFVIAEYQNTTEESVTPLFQFSITAFQDGVELETTYNSYEPDGCKSSTTKIKPGATLKFSNCYKLSSTSPVDIEVTPVFNFDDKSAECTFDLSTQAPVEEKKDYEAMYKKLEKQFNELQKKYDKLQKEYDKLAKK